jgi:hypothetical protein
MVGVWGRESTELMPTTRTRYLVSCVARCVARAKACAMGRCWAGRSAEGICKPTISEMVQTKILQNLWSRVPSVRCALVYRERRASRHFRDHVRFQPQALLCRTRALCLQAHIRSVERAADFSASLTHLHVPRSAPCASFVSTHFNQPENHCAHPPPGLVFRHRRSGQVLGVPRVPLLVRFLIFAPCHLIPSNFTRKP